MEEREILDDNGNLICTATRVDEYWRVVPGGVEPGYFVTEGILLSQGFEALETAVRIMCKKG